jgi:dihydropteroate synthase
MTDFKTEIMGVLNVTPDSFSDGGQFSHIDRAVSRAKEMSDQGAAIIDIGGESTRPGADVVDENTELSRVLPVIKAVRTEKIKARISIDTRRPNVAMAAIKAGASIWNDVTALSFEKTSADVAADLGCDVVLMHMKGTPKNMQSKPEYDDVMAEVRTYLNDRMKTAVSAGVKKKNIILDPGIGFGKRLPDNLDLLLKFHGLFELGCPILIGASRKSFINKIDGSCVDERLGGSLAAALWASHLGASILRVHDVKETAQALKIWQAIGSRENVE